MHPPTDARRLLIIDTDSGVDDAIALYFALAHPAIELLGLCATFGNVATAQSVRTALNLCALTRRPLPVCEGVHTPLRCAPVQPETSLHGDDGLGRLPASLQAPHPQAPHPQSAARFIVDAARAHPGAVAFVAHGPLGNLAQALRLEPHLPELLGPVVVAGGSVLAPGNVTPVAEANIWHDPHAADTVLTAGFDLRLVGLDVAEQLRLPIALFERLAAHHRHRATDALLHATQHYAAALALSSDEPACEAHALLAVIALLHPELIVMRQGRLRVATDGLARGQTIFDRAPRRLEASNAWDEHIPMLQAALGVDAAACAALFERVLHHDWLPN